MFLRPACGHTPGAFCFRVHENVNVTVGPIDARADVPDGQEVRR
jgi:hypothetical protein